MTGLETGALKGKDTHAIGVSFNYGVLSGFSVAVKFAANPRLIRGIMQAAEDVKFIPAGVDYMKFTAAHELGHRLTVMLDLDTDKRIIALFESENVRGGLSENGASNIREFIADAWAEARTSKSPRPLAHKLDSIIKDILDSYNG